MTSKEDPGPEASTVHMTAGLPETVLPAEPVAVMSALEAAKAEPAERRRNAVSEVVRSNPSSLEAWAALGALAGDDVEAYACFRVGYHRGLDSLRRSGWKGSGLVRWDEPTNRGFLRSLDGLRSAAGALGEHEEEERCLLFLRQLDPTWRPGRDRDSA